MTPPYFCIFVIISPLKGAWSFIWTHLKPPLPKDDVYQVWLNLAKRFLRRSRKCEKLTDRQMDGRTDDGQKAIRIAHLNLRFRWANKQCCVSAILTCLNTVTIQMLIIAFQLKLVQWFWRWKVYKQTDDRQKVIRKSRLSFQFRCAKNQLDISVTIGNFKVQETRNV